MSLNRLSQSIGGTGLLKTSDRVAYDEKGRVGMRLGGIDSTVRAPILDGGLFFEFSLMRRT
jgi:hypothetical protein